MVMIKHRRAIMAAQELGSVSYQSKNLDHLGLVSAMCQELEIAKEIDKVIPKSSKQKVSIGKLVEAMILNGLGFTSKALYMTPKYFSDKPVERLLGPGIQAENLNDDALGRALDAIFEFNATDLYSRIAMNACKILKLSSKIGYLDSTSFHVDGKYNSEDKPEECAKVVHVTKGYSRDHRPEANQIMLNLIVENQAAIPVFMQAASGNQSDPTGFRAIIKDHISELKNWTGIEYVSADSALYSAATLQELANQHLFFTRVPETIIEAQAAIKIAAEAEFVRIDDNYGYVEQASRYAGVEQRWLVIKSSHAAKAEAKTVQKIFLKCSRAEAMAFKKLCVKNFACTDDAMMAYNEFTRKLKYIVIDGIETIATKHYAGRGKPKQDEVPSSISYSLSGTVYVDIQLKEKLDKQSGMFILATNELDKARLSNAEILASYKGQQKVERGFKFLKNPYFFTASFFVQKVERMMSLLMIMTLCLMVYAAIEHRLRQALVAQDKVVLDRLKKPTQTPTTRWIFECFAGIHTLIINNATELILNLNEMHLLTLNLLGSSYEQVYSKKLTL